MDTKALSWKLISKDHDIYTYLVVNIAEWLYQYSTYKQSWEDSLHNLKTNIKKGGTIKESYIGILCF